MNKKVVFLEVELFCPKCVSKIFRDIMKSDLGIKLRCDKCESEFNVITLPDSRFWIIIEK